MALSRQIEFCTWKYFDTKGLVLVGSILLGYIWTLGKLLWYKSLGENRGWTWWSLCCFFPYFLGPQVTGPALEEASRWSQCSLYATLHGFEPWCPSLSHLSFNGKEGITLPPSPALFYIQDINSHDSKILRTFHDRKILKSRRKSSQLAKRSKGFWVMPQNQLPFS